MLARLAGMVSGVRRVTVRRMGVVAGLLVSVGFVMLGGLAMMASGALVVLGGRVVMLDDLVFGHGALRQVNSLSLGGGCCMAVTAHCGRCLLPGERDQSGVTPNRRCQNSRDRLSPTSQ